MDIAVAGCGITGTAVAYFLAKAGHKVTLFEQAQTCGPIGAGIMLQPSGQAVLREMSLLDQVIECSEKLNGMTAKLVSGKNLVQLHYEDLETGLYGIGAHRGRLFQLLYNSCQEAGAVIHTGSRVCGYEGIRTTQPTKTRVLLATDEGPLPFGEFDFVIGADGSDSAIRKQLEQNCNSKSRTIEYDYAALWMTTQSEYRSMQLTQVVEGTNKLVGLLPIGQNECSFFWGLKANDFERLVQTEFDHWKEEVLKICPEANELLDNKSRFEEFTFARYRHVKIKRPYDASVILLGDAAHATSPHLGQGANLGLEDALLFARVLEESQNDFDVACNLFAKRRSKQIKFYQSLTRILTPFFQSDGRLKGILRDLFLPWFPRIPFIRKQMLRTLCGMKKGWLA